MSICVSYTYYTVILYLSTLGQQIVHSCHSLGLLLYRGYSVHTYISHIYTPQKLSVSHTFFFHAGIEHATSITVNWISALRVAATVHHCGNCAVFMLMVNRCYCLVYITNLLPKSHGLQEVLGWSQQDHHCHWNHKTIRYEHNMFARQNWREFSLSIMSALCELMDNRTNSDRYSLKTANRWRHINIGCDGPCFVMLTASAYANPLPPYRRLGRAVSNGVFHCSSKSDWYCKGHYIDALFLCICYGNVRFIATI